MQEDPGAAEPTPHDPPAAPVEPPAPLAASPEPPADPAQPPPSQITDTLVGAPRVDVTALPGAAVPSFLLSPPAPAAAPPRRASTTFLVAVAVTSFVADMVTKGWAKGRLSSLGHKGHALRRMPIWKDHVEFVFAQNPGGAWSFLRGLPDTLRRPFFLVVSAAAIVFIITIYQRVHHDQRAMRWGLPLALGGAIGNLADRMRYGWVVDFIDFSMKWGGRDHHWPTFNVADIAIVLGVALMGMDMLRARRHHAGDHVAHAPAA